MRRFLKNLTGLLFLLIGIAGLFLPFIQGILMIVAGLALIDLPAKQRLHRWLKGRLTSYRWVAVRHMRLLRRWRRHRYLKTLAAAKAREEELRRAEGEPERLPYDQEQGSR